MEFDRTKRYPYCIQCVDQTSGKTGDFAYDPTKGKGVGNFHAITPVFDDLGEFYRWCKANGFHYHHGQSMDTTEYS